jgi:PilZ domain-containing protein
VPTDPSAPIRVDIMGNGFLDVLHARDISRGGLGIRVPHGFEGCDIDSKVELIITLGRARPFKAKGVIRHYSKTVKDHVFGLEFIALAPEQLEAVEAYIQACLRRRSRGAMRVPSMPARS